MRYLLTGGGAATPRRFPGLQDAMSAASHPSAAAWNLAPGFPDRIVTSPRSGLPCRIDAPDVGHELVDAATVIGCVHLSRAWSRCDPIIINAVVGYFQDGGSYLPLLQSWQMAARIAGHFAAAGELTLTRITAAILAAYDDSCLDCGASLASAITGQVAGLLHGIRVPVYDDRPDTGTLADLARLPLAPCRVYRGGQAEDRLAGTYPTLPGAMAATGHPGFGGWQFSPDDTSQITWPAPPGRGGPGGAAEPGWVIRASGVTRLYAEACPDDARMRRCWSAADNRIAVAAEAALSGRATGLAALPARAAARVAARLAAQYATGGLTADGILAVLLDTSTRAGVEPPLQAAARLAARIADHLAETGITVAGAAGTVAALRPAPPVPAIRPGPPARPDPGPAPRPAGRVSAAVAATLDMVFWWLTAPLERLHQATRRPGRLRRLRAALPILICGWRQRPRRQRGMGLLRARHRRVGAGRSRHPAHLRRRMARPPPRLRAEPGAR